MYMNHFSKLRLSFYVALIFVSIPIFAAKTSIKNVYRYTLPNGLELFVMENNASPLAYIEIAVRAGGVTQTPETAGLFHLYEHMMFKGNEKYQNQAAVQAALTKMGISNWNGSTGVDRINYYFTVPSSQLQQGLEFWSYAIRTPRLDAQELENEKSVVLSEITADETDPAHIFSSALARQLYAESPWQLDPSGAPSTVKNATEQTLRDIQNKYYVPNNAALFVGGAVRHKEVYKLVKQIFGSWKKGKAISAIAVPSKEPFTTTSAQRKNYFVYADPRSSGNYLQAALYFRGPDGESDLQDTYAADVWTGLLSNPGGFFSTSLVQDNALHIPDPDYVGGYYFTRRAAGIISLSAAMLCTQEPVEQAEHFFNKLSEFCTTDFSDTKTFLTSDALERTKQQKADKQIYAQESVSALLSELSSVWAACGADYFFTYAKQFEKVQASDVQSFVARYLTNKIGMAAVFISPELYETHKDAFSKAGYQLITSENAFWWKN